MVRMRTPELYSGPQDTAEVLRPGAMTGQARKPSGLGPSAVPIHDDADMDGDFLQWRVYFFLFRLSHWGKIGDRLSGKMRVGR
jgi:hypothetical protein